MDRYALSLQSRDMATTQSDLAWIDELITDERDAGAGPVLPPKVRTTKGA
jgi:hypothetical protein